MDIWDKKKRSEVMAKVKNKDTKPELYVRKFLFSRGFRYRKNVDKMPGCPDIVLPRYKTVIFINGCFWHGHSVDGRIPLSNMDFWTKKIEKNRERDEKNTEELKKLGWNVIVVWECELSTREKRVMKLKSIERMIRDRLTSM